MNENQSPQSPDPVTEITVRTFGKDLPFSLPEMVEEITREVVTERIGHIVDNQIRVAISKRMEALTLDVIRESIKAETERVMAQGWQRTDSYGNPTGKPKTLSALIVDQLESKDSYATDKWFTKLLKEITEAAIRKDLGEVIGKAKTDLAAMLGKTALEAVRDVVLKAAGLKQ